MQKVIVIFVLLVSSRMDNSGGGGLFDNLALEILQKDFWARLPLRGADILVGVDFLG
jgi:hypothetical protein